MTGYIIILILAIFFYNIYTNRQIKKLKNESKLIELEMRIKILEDKQEKDKN